jgi:hypothetical protein
MLLFNSQTEDVRAMQKLSVKWKTTIGNIIYCKIAGGFAGFVGSTFSGPADILKVRMQACEKINPPNLRWHVADIHSHWGY